MSSKENVEIQVSSCSKRNEDSVKLLGIHVNNNLKFDCHVNQLCKEANKKFHSLARIATLININKRRMLMKDFVFSQFSYCLLIRIFQNRNMEHRISSIYKKALKLVYDDPHDHTSQKLLAKGSQLVFPRKNSQLLATGVTP